ncbi:MAG: YggS family pyridoxal phosphate-dependent enzyme, partial [Clostridiaceae bacterium]|nr:YggS family pyridoxal phosphate-dependent enzyme [Clostridiaceae bacterium]
IESGLDNYGENRAQDFLKKQIALPGFKWHFIGHLQTNKVKLIVNKVCLIHGVDSLDLAKQIDTQAKELGITQKILIQLNLSGEVSKFGMPQTQLPHMLEGVQDLHNIRVCGLMTMAPFGASEATLKNLFEKCNNLFIDIRGKKYHNIVMESLSMGMTSDFEAAIECGANIVRVGTGIFGNRN